MAISTAFNTAVTGLKSHQTALDVTSNNISNASNPDYVRERAVFTTNDGIRTTPGTIGMGVQISSIYRITDTFLFNRLTASLQQNSYLTQKDRYLREISTYMPDVQDQGIFKNLEDFFNAWQTLASNPDNGSVKVDLAQKTLTLTDSIKNLRNKLLDIQKNINEELDTKIDEVNNIVKNIASLNQQITRVEANNIDHANELRDKRDALEKRLKELVNVKVYKNNVKSIDAQGQETVDYDNDYTITLGGYPLVSNSTAYELVKTTDKNNVVINIKKEDSSLVDITDNINNGEIGALLELRGNEFNDKGESTNGVVGELLNNLNTFANTMIKNINSIYGMASKENMRGDKVFDPISVEAYQNRTWNELYAGSCDCPPVLKDPVKNGILTLNSYDNNGNLQKTISVKIDPNKTVKETIDDINNALKNNGIDSQLEFVNGELKFVRSDTNGDGVISTSSVLVKDDGANMFSALNELEYLPLNKVNSSLPFTVEDGSFYINVYNSNGDVLAKREISIDSTSDDPKYSTLQGVIAQINTPNIDDNNDNDSTNDVDDYYQASFVNGIMNITRKTDDNVFVGFDKDGAKFAGAMGLNKFLDGTDASNIDLDLALKEDPSLIRANQTPASGDNAVANAMLNFQYEDINFYQDGKLQTTTTIYGYYKDMTTKLANDTQTNKTKLDTSETVLKSIQDEYYSLSGVNIDEELINLEKFQRGYQANAKVISTINQMLDALFGIKQ
jgi:flagellar hook-associated protein 1 FlgK